MAPVIQAILIGLALNGLLSVSDYQSRITELNTPPNIPASLQAYDAPGKEYYLQSLSKAWYDAENAKNETRDMLALYLKEAESSLFLSSYCKAKLEQVYYDASQAFSGMAVLIEKDAEVLEEMGVADQEYSGKAKPVYLDLKETVKAVKEAGSNKMMLGENAEKVRKDLNLASAGGNVYNTLVGYPDSLFTLMFSQHKRFLHALQEIEAEYKQEKQTSEELSTRLSYRVKEYESNALDMVVWDSLPLEQREISSSGNMSVKQAYYIATSWLAAHDGRMKKFSVMYANGRKAKAIILLHGYNTNASSILLSLEGALQQAVETEPVLRAQARQKFSQANPESALYPLAKQVCSSTSRKLGERINLLKKCITFSEKTHSTPDQEKKLAEKLCASLRSVGIECKPDWPDDSSPDSRGILKNRLRGMQEKLEEYKEIARQLSAKAWEKYYTLKTAGASEEFLDRIHYRLLKADQSDLDDNIGNIIKEYQDILLDLDKQLATISSGYSLLLPTNPLPCSAETYINATIMFTGPKTTAYQANIKLPPGLFFPDNSQEKHFSSAEKAVNISLLARPECKVIRNEQVKADNEKVYYEKEYQITSPLPVILPEGETAVSKATVLYTKPCWLISQSSRTDQVFRIRVINPGASLKNILLSYPVEADVESCNSCIQHDGRILFLISSLNQGEVKTLAAVLSAPAETTTTEYTPTIINGDQPPADKPEYSFTSQPEYTDFAVQSLLKPAPDTPAPITRPEVKPIIEEPVIEEQQAEESALKPSEGSEKEEDKTSQEKTESNNYSYYAVPLGFAAFSFFMLKKQNKKKLVRRTL